MTRLASIVVAAGLAAAALTPAARAQWTDLGNGLAGISGIPALAGAGTLMPASAGSLTLANAKPSALAMLFVSFVSMPAPFKGGTLVTVPWSLSITLATSPSGTMALPFTWPVGIPMATSVYFQFAIKDPAAAVGVALSNAVKGTTPAPATLVINEVNPSLASGDLVELRVLTSGTLAGLSLQQDITTGIVTLATLPSIYVTAGDLIVVHMNPTGVSTELTSQIDCASAACYPAAWDVAGTGMGMTYGSRVVAVTAGTTVIDGVPFVTGSTFANFPANLQLLQSAGQWLPSQCGGSPCTYVTAPPANDPSVSVNWTGLTATSSMQRKPGPDTNTVSDWNAPAPATFGLANP